jgi:NhaP-type Na+/H+ or K+/H+ antiporter/CRP-like cAMP-binding protein
MLCKHCSKVTIAVLCVLLLSTCRFGASTNITTVLDSEEHGQTTVSVVQSYDDVSLHDRSNDHDDAYSSHDDDEDHVSHTSHDSVVVTLLYPLTVLLFGAFVEQFLHSSPVPYTVIIFLLGALFGIIQSIDEGPLSNTTCTIDNLTDCMFGDLSVSANQVAHIDPHFLLNLFLPILIFESAFSVDWHVFKNIFGNATLLAGPGLVVASMLTACWVIFCRVNTDVIGTNWENSDRKWAMGLLFGVISSATDPVAVVSVLKTVGAPKYLSITIEGESLLNDGIAVVAFTVLFDLVRFGVDFEIDNAMLQFLLMVGGGILWGIAMGVFMTMWISLAYDQAIVEVTVTVMISYLTFFVGEQYMHVSGVLSVVSLGIYFSAVGHYSITPAVLHEVHSIWEWLGFLANTLVFGITGVLITRPTIEMIRIDEEDNLTSVIGWLGLNLLCLNLALILIRAFVFLLSYGILHYCGKDGYKMDWRDCIISVWGALRGAVGLALAMVVSLDARSRDVNAERCQTDYNNETGKIDIIDAYGCGGILENNTADTIAYKRFSEHLLVGVVSIVCFTLLFNSTTLKPLMGCLKMNTMSEAQLRLFEMAMEKIDDAAIQEINVLRDDTSLQGVDWEAVRNARYEVARRNDLAMSKSLLHRLRSKRRAALMKTKEAKMEARRRFLAACVSSYHHQNASALLSGRSLRILTEANCQAVDKDCDIPQEWIYVVKKVPFLGLADYMDKVDHRDLFKASCAAMLKLLCTGKLDVFFLLLHLKSRKNRFMSFFVGWFLASSIARACDTASAFMNAREEAIDLLRTYLQEDNYSNFYATAQADMATAARAVLCCHRFFPDIVRGAETNRAKRIILHLQKKKTRSLIAEGVLDTNLGAKVVKSLDQRIQRVILKQRYCPKTQSSSKHMLLHEISWLQGLPSDVMQEVEKVAVKREFTMDEVIINSGMRPEYIFVIVQGSVAIHMNMNHLSTDVPESLPQSRRESLQKGNLKSTATKKADTVSLNATHMRGKPDFSNTKSGLKRRISELLGNQKQIAKSGTFRDLFLGKMSYPMVQLSTGSSIGELSWINEVASRTKFCAIASSSTVEVIGLPLDFVKNNKAIQESLWMATGRKIVETVLSKQGRFKTWPKQQLVREVAKWKIQQFAKLASADFYTAVSFCMPVVLMHGEAFKLSHKCRLRESQRGPVNEEGLENFQVIVTKDELLASAQAGNVLCRLEGPRYLRPHAADERMDDSQSTTVTWYIRSESWLCFNDHARFHYITGESDAARQSAAYSNMRNVFRKYTLGHQDVNRHITTENEVGHVGSAVQQGYQRQSNNVSFGAMVMLQELRDVKSWSQDATELSSTASRQVNHTPSGIHKFPSRGQNYSTNKVVPLHTPESDGDSIEIDELT